MNRSITTFILALPLMAHSLAAHAAPRVVTLQSALELALHNNLELAVSRNQLGAASALNEQARAASYPKIMGTAVLSPLYSSTGDAVHSENDTSRWGYWLQSSVTILQPLYMWGKISNFRHAATEATEVYRANVRKSENQIIFEVKELYYGSILVETLFRFLEDGKKDIDEIVAKIEHDQERQNKKNQLPKREYFRLKIFAAEAVYRFEEAAKLRMLARHALSLKLGFDPAEETIPSETSLAPIEAEPPSEDTLAHQLLEHRPEFSQLRHGIAAKKALLEAERTNKFPLFFAGGMLTFAHSNVRTGQQSAFAYDPYNRSSGGVGIGVQWSWDFATTLANESAIRVEIDELEKKQTYAVVGLKMELKKLLADLKESKMRLSASRDAFQIGKKWLVSETMGYSLGVTEIKNLVDAYLARAKTAKDHWEAIYRVNMGWAELSRALGIEVTPGLKNI